MGRVSTNGEVGNAKELAGDAGGASTLASMCSATAMEGTGDGVVCPQFVAEWSRTAGAPTYISTLSKAVSYLELGNLYHQ